MVGSLYLLTQHLQFVLAYGPLEAGLRTAPLAVTVVVLNLAGVVLAGGLLAALLLRRAERREDTGAGPGFGPGPRPDPRPATGLRSAPRAPVPPE